MATVKQLIDGSLRLIGVAGEGSKVTSEQYRDALFALNALLSSWSTNFYMVSSETINTFTLTPGKHQYTLGPTGSDWVMQTPARIDNVNVKLGSQEYSLNILDSRDYSLLAASGASMTYPSDVMIQYGYQDTLTFWPIPGSPAQVIIYSWKRLPEFNSINDVVDLSAGYMQAIRFNLALELAPEYGINPLPTVVYEAKRALNAITDANSTRKDYKLEYDGYKKYDDIAARTHGLIA